MWLKIGTRRDLLDTFSGDNILSGLKQIDQFPLKEPKNDELYIVWFEQPKLGNSIPSQIIVPSGAVRDFLAWVITFFTDYRPFTAYCRVLDWSQANAFHALASSANLGDFSNPASGVIVAEALWAGGRRGMKALTPLDCTSTLSYVCARSLAIGYASELRIAGTKSWALANQFTNTRVLPAKTISVVWDVVFALVDSKSNSGMSPEVARISDACYELQKTGTISPQLIKNFLGDWFRFPGDFIEMSGTREQRVTQVDRALLLLRENKGGHELERSFIYGYLVSLIDPGSLAHFELVTRTADILPSALLWFGLCAGLHKTKGAQSVASGVARRILRDLTQPVSANSRPTCDISIAELEILVTADNPLLDFKTGTPGYLSVELLPGVTTCFKWSTDSRGAPINHDLELDLWRSMENEQRRLLQDMAQSVEKINYCQDRLMRNFSQFDEMRRKGTKR